MAKTGQSRLSLEPTETLSPRTETLPIGLIDRGTWRLAGWLAGWLDRTGKDGTGDFGGADGNRTHDPLLAKQVL